VARAPAVVESRAESDPCPVCGRRVYVDEHAAEIHAGNSLRVVRVSCRFCGHRQERFYRIRSTPPT